MEKLGPGDRQCVGIKWLAALGRPIHEHGRRLNLQPEVTEG